MVSFQLMKFKLVGKDHSSVSNPHLTRVDSIGKINSTEDKVLDLITVSELSLADHSFVSIILIT